MSGNYRMFFGNGGRSDWFFTSDRFGIPHCDLIQPDTDDCGKEYCPQSSRYEELVLDDGKPE
jgi:hypothetical protein